MTEPYQLSDVECRAMAARIAELEAENARLRAENQQARQWLRIADDPRWTEIAADITES